MQGIRDRVVLSTKNHHHDKSDAGAWRRNLEDSLERLRTDHIDIYNFHGLNWETFQASLAGDDGLYRLALAAKEEGVIRHIWSGYLAGPYCEETTTEVVAKNGAQSRACPYCREIHLDATGKYRTTAEAEGMSAIKTVKW
jgi:hypothetical protein